jgi:soluble lytic murein transglycosylase-like protein
LKYLITILTILVALQILLINNELKKIHSLYEFTPVEFTPLKKNQVKQVQVKRTPLKEVEFRCNQYLPIIEKYSWNAQTALKVMKAESSCNPKAINLRDSHKGCRGSYNLFQVACIHYKSDQSKDDIELNVQLAYKVYTERGWKPWAVCTTGIVKCL